jgi:hypothetical protein
MGSSHPASFVAVRKGSFDQLPAFLQELLAVAAFHPPPISVYGLPLLCLTLPPPSRSTALSRDGLLTWRWYREWEKEAERNPPKLQKPSSDLCLRFARLAEGSDENIRAFAEQWGPLGLPDRAEERIAEWRRYAKLTNALLRFTAERLTGAPGREEDWVVIVESTKIGKLDRKELKLNKNTQTAIMASAVNTWFADAKGHQILEIVDGQPRVRPGASNLFGVLITQIAHAIARTDQLTICAGCRYPFRPKRPLSRGLRRYCPGCRKAKFPERDAARDWRRRKRLHK